MSSHDDLVLGIDGGGTKTVAWLARCRAEGDPSILGRGISGGSNPQAVGLPTALENLSQAVDAATSQARVGAGPVAAAVVCLAGSDRAVVQQPILRWADERQVARRCRVEHDAMPVLAAGSPEGWGVALICGTGSFAFGRDRQGRTARAGGWGFLLGDEGSGYAIARAGLRAATRAADGRGPATRLLESLLVRLECRSAPDLVPTVYRFAGNPGAVAALAPVVIETAESADETAQSIVAKSGEDLADTVAAVLASLNLKDVLFPLALTGGLLLGHRLLCDALQAGLVKRGLRPAPVVPVPEPVAGAVQLAIQLRAETLRGVP